MNKNILIIGVIILGLGLIIVLNQQMQRSKITNEKVAMSEKNSFLTGTEEDKMMKIDNASRYVEYSKDSFNKTAKRRVLYFYASWCPECRPTDANLKENSSRIPEDMIVIRVNYNDPDTDQEEKDLAKKYAVTYQHTFIQIDTLGKEITRWNGGQIEELLANIK